MKHTPGPWSVNATPQSSNQNWVVLDSAPGHHKRVCAVYSSNDEADARLIAESPAMLASLTEAIDLVPRISEDDPMSPALAEWCRGIKAIVARIEGKP